MKKTLVGMAPVSSTPPPTGEVVPRGGGALGQGRTVLGLPSPMADIPPTAGPGGGPAAGGPGHKKTMMGVAMPGIAPLAPGVAKETPLPRGHVGATVGVEAPGRTVGVETPGQLVTQENPFLPA